MVGYQQMESEEEKKSWRDVGRKGCSKVYLQPKSWRDLRTFVTKLQHCSESYQAASAAYKILKNMPCYDLTGVSYSTSGFRKAENISC